MHVARVGIVYAVLLGLAGAAWAALTPAVTAADLDRAQCRAFAGRRALDGPADGVLEGLLGLAALPPKGAWSTGPQPEKVLHFRVAFTAPVALGTLYTDFDDGQTPGVPLRAGRYAGYLKPDAAYPGDVTRDDQWVMLPAGALRALPPSVKTRALRFTVIGGEWGYGAGGDRFTATLSPIRLFTERYYSAVNLGHSRTSGKEGQPKTWFGDWAQPQAVAGLLLVGKQPGAAVKYLKPACTVSPVVALPTDWGKAKDLPGADGIGLLRFDAPITTRALQLYPCAGTVYPLVDLGAAPFAPSLDPPPPPFRVKYTMPMDGFAAVDILDKDGKLVRHLVAEVARAKGAVDEPWDMKDERGNPVPPGTYSYRAIARPPFTLTYQTTVYNAGQPAWWAPEPGKGGGGWLADHTPPNCAVACGDLMFLAAPCNESGHGVIAVDHAGNKVWGEPYVTGFDIARNMAADDRFVYVVNPAVVQRIDTKDPTAKTDKFSAKNFITFAYTRTLPQGRWDATHGGLALYKDKLYVAHNAPPVSWLQTCFLPETLDPEHSYPRVWLKRGGGKRAAEYQNDKNYTDEQYDELMGFYAAFQTGSTPAKTSTWPSTGLPSSTQAYFGDAPTSGPLANLLIAAFAKPVTVSSIVIPNKMPVFALKPGAELPADDAGGLDPEGNDDEENGLLNEDDWVPLTVTGKAGQPCIALAPAGGLTTRALRFGATRLDFALTMNRRFTDIAGTAERVYSEGSETKNGAWALTRPKNQAVNAYNAPKMALVWPQPVALRGVVIVRPTTGVMAVDIFTGTGDPKAALADDKAWKEMGRFSPEKFAGWYWQLPTVKSVDFGEVRQVRAVRVRALTPSSSHEPEVGGDWPADRPTVFTGILACAPLGGDPANLDADMSQRIEEYAIPDDPAAPPTLVRNILFRDPGHMVCDKKGTLYTVSDGQVVTVPLHGGEGKVVVSADKVETPCDLAFDADGLLYVTDVGAQTVKVFNPATGALVRTIGKPGGHPLGPWDPNYLDNPTGVAVDSAGKVWVVSSSWAPKRISRWSRDGKFEADFLGPTQYGGGGWLDEGDKSVLNYAGMKFVIDWRTFDWKLDSILYKSALSVDGSAPDRPLYHKGRRYLAGSAGVETNALLCVERDHKAVPLVSIGPLRNWAEVARRPDLLKAFGSLDRAKYAYVWSDLNGDGVPQATEVQISDQTTMHGGGMFGDDLAFNFAGGRLRPTGVLPNGVPTYDIAKLEKLPRMSGRGWSNAEGRTFTMVNQWDRLLDTDGSTTAWEYFDEFAIHAGWYASNWGYDRPPGKLNAEQNIFGHLRNVGPNKEEYWITSSDQGDWFCFTSDGMLVGCIFGGPTGYGLRRWTMPEWTPNKTDLTDLRLLLECYQGCVVRAEDGKVYAVAGKNHASVVRVDGLEALQRLRGPVTVTAKDLDDTRTWEVARAAAVQMKDEEKAARVPYLDEPVQANGALDEWAGDLFFTVHEYDERGLNLFRHVVHSTAALSYDEDNLYVAVRALDDSPMRNNVVDPQTLFKTGDAVDVQLALDPAADPKRTSPVAGDVRILITRAKDNPVVMLYRPKDPAAPVEKRVHFTSPVGETWVDVVRPIDDAEVGVGVEGAGKGQEFVLEAAIPWKALGVAAPKIGTRLRGDVGILQSDQYGVQTVNRLYWSGKSQRVVADLPSEARLSPILWGTFYFTEPTGNAGKAPGDDLVP